MVELSHSHFSQRLSGENLSRAEVGYVVGAVQKAQSLAVTRVGYERWLVRW
jgi:hypothetical protein